MRSMDGPSKRALEACDRLGIGLLQTDGRRRIAEANEHAGRLLRFRHPNLIGRTLMEVFLDHRVEEMVDRAAPDGGRPMDVTSSGEPPFVLEVRAWRSEDGSAWVAIQDVSEVRRLRRIRAEFIDNLAHELRTPLASVRLLSEGLAIELERTDVTARAREVASRIDVETARLAQMVSELLDLAAIEQGEAPLRSQEFDLALLLREVAERLRAQADSVGARLSMELPEDAGALRFNGDRESIGRMVQNLIDNAIKFSPAGAEVAVRARSEAAGIVVEVVDQGPGIPMADRDRVFERFYKVDPARGGPAGTGLGLSIAKHIAERHGGRIWVESREGAGSTFFVTLPLGAGSQAGG